MFRRTPYNLTPVVIFLDFLQMHTLITFLYIFMMLIYFAYLQYFDYWICNL